MHDWAMLHAAIALGGETPSSRGELRQHEDRNGLLPRALLALRWRVVGAEVEAPASSPAGLTRRDAPRVR